MLQQCAKLQLRAAPVVPVPYMKYSGIDHQSLTYQVSAGSAGEGRSSQRSAPRPGRDSVPVPADQNEDYLHYLPVHSIFNQCCGAEIILGPGAGNKF